MNKRLKSFGLGLLVPGLMLVAGTTMAADYKERTLKFSYLNAKEHPQGLGAQKFADLVAEKSGGKIKVRTFPGGTLGGDLQTLSALQGGTVEMTVMNSGILVGLAKEFAAVDMPFLFNSAAEADALLDGPFGKTLHDKLPEKGVLALGYWDLGFRNLTNNRRPVTKVDDVAGLKIRVIQTPIYIDTFKALGANPVPLPFTELYTALETRTVDGQENPSKTIELSKLYEVQKHLTVTRHIYNPQSLLISKAFWDKLTPDEQTLFRDAAAEATAYQRKVSREQDAEALNALRAKGVQVVELPAAELNQFREKVKPVVEKYKAEVGPALVEQMYAEIAKVRAGK
ncbi:TRAP transporter substrate-binding protein [Azospirillum canadense]|uniref:TRAP transporter substrate-binding protein n=1 Tax=Azospirillum canadense TaxID=403962 RepID=UPI00222770B8|nr:TRAP transporter substrate-binding protein [Azospirillum canadense]MCW2242595.1 tripartite ATP-independent transporter DctP family solute receptor [Azospirillum canadense]